MDPKKPATLPKTPLAEQLLSSELSGSFGKRHLKHGSVIGDFFHVDIWPSNFVIAAETRVLFKRKHASDTKYLVLKLSLPSATI